MSTKF